MIDHRRVQRALFRMQLDPEFAHALRAGESEAVRSTGLAGAGLALVRAADSAGVSADCGGRRRAQFLRNVSQEFALTLAEAPGLADRFTSSPEFHRAVTRDSPLPLALASHLAALHSSPLLELETALARARRARRPPIALGPGEVALAPWVELLELPDGTLAAAERIRAALDAAESPAPSAPVSGRECEVLLLRRDPEPAPFRTPQVEVERLSPALARLLGRATKPLCAHDREAEARAADVSLAELEQIVAGLISDRVLVTSDSFLYGPARSK